LHAAPERGGAARAPLLGGSAERVRAIVKTAAARQENRVRIFS
jgi:hypothetical protein